MYSSYLWAEHGSGDGGAPTPHVDWQLWTNSTTQTSTPSYPTTSYAQGASNTTSSSYPSLVATIINAFHDTLIPTPNCGQGSVGPCSQKSAANGVIPIAWYAADQISSPYCNPNDAGSGCSCATLDAGSSCNLTQWNDISGNGNNASTTFYSDDNFNEDDILVPYPTLSTQMGGLPSVQFPSFGSGGVSSIDSNGPMSITASNGITVLAIVNVGSIPSPPSPEFIVGFGGYFTDGFALGLFEPPSDAGSSTLVWGEAFSGTYATSTSVSSGPAIIVNVYTGLSSLGNLSVNTNYLYLNGSLITSTSPDSDLTISSGYVRLGGDSNEGYSSWNGSISEVAVFNQAAVDLYPPMHQPIY